MVESISPVVEKYLSPDGDCFVDKEEGCSWESPLDYALTHMLGFCGCGSPEAAGKLIRDILIVLEKQFDIPYEEYRKGIKDLLPNDGLEMVVFYFLDNQGIIEHGTCVPGWLTQKGKDLLEILKASPLDAPTDEL